MPSKRQTYIQESRLENMIKLKLPTIRQNNSEFAKKYKSKQKSNKSNADEEASLYTKKKKDKIVPLKGIRTKIMRTQPSQQFSKLQKLEKEIMMQIKNIDVCMQSQRNEGFKTTLFKGYIFMNEVNSHVVQRFHECLQIQSQASNAIVQGYEIPKIKLDKNGQARLVQAEVIKKIPSIHNRMLDRSMKNVARYDIQRIEKYQHDNRRQWSLVKRTPQTQNQEQTKNKNRESTSNQSNQNNSHSFIKSFSKRTLDRSTKMVQSRISYLSKHPLLNELTQTKNSKSTMNSKYSRYTSVKTQPSQLQEVKQTVIVTKKDVKHFLQSSKNSISIWIPPSSYPQFYGIFSYKLIKKNQPIPMIKCRLIKYFFYKFGLKQRIFDAILQWISQQIGTYVEFLEIIIDKHIFNQTFAKFGWTLKYWQSHNKVKAVYKASSK